MIPRRVFLTGLAASGLTACAAESVLAPMDVVEARAFRSDEPTHLRLLTMRNTGSDNGAHSAVLVQASQRVMFDPAGSFSHPTIPERNDLLYGITPRVEQYYISYHARQTYYVEAQYLEVSPAVAEQAFMLFQRAGPVAQANCTRVTSRVLRQLPGLERLPQTWFPGNLADAFGKLPGVRTEIYREQDSDDKSLAAQQIDMQIRADLTR